MCAAKPLPPEALRRCCDPAAIPFDTTAEVQGIGEFIGQDRALDAVRFGVAIRRDGYNLFAIGPPGTGKQTLLRQLLERHASSKAPPGDWCYVNNFSDPHRPRALKLPQGVGGRLRSDMERLVEELKASLPAAFEGEPYRTRKQQVLRKYKELQEAAFAEVQERARQRQVAVVQTEAGILVAPLKDGQVLESDQFRLLPPEERERLQAAMESTKEDLAALFRRAHDLEKEQREALRALDRETSAMVTRRQVDELRARYQELPEVLDYLNAVEADVVDNVHDFLHPEGEGLEAALRRALHGAHHGPSYRKYVVNVVVDNAAATGAPVVFEANPTYSNLIGRIEHVAELGALVTDFTLIKAGSLHRASGGYLLIEALKLLQQPFSWEALKRAIRSREIRIESIGQLLGVTPTVTLEPEPISLDDCKVVLFGERILYYLLSALDPDFLELFKVIVDFEESTDRDEASQSVYARLIATLTQKEGLRPFDRSAVSCVLEHAARLAGDAEKLSVKMRPVVDLLRETDHWAESAGRAVATQADVQKAIDEQMRRAGRLRERVLEEIRRGTILIDTQGERVGQVNGLSAVRLGEFDFGYPTRITARVRVGKGEVVNIEREVELSGPIHSKGVLILAGFLGARYAKGTPLSLSASLVFEQSYNAVEGDSASLAELCALLSALAELPIRQGIAVTGSVNQHGQVQAVGGVNEKIEGFFDVCRDRGLTGDQAVLIPHSNAKNLMLRSDVVEAVAQGKFRILVVESVDDALEALTGKPREEANRLVESRLAAFAESARAFLARPGSEQREP